jgi:hypothetical protein
VAASAGRIARSSWICRPSAARIASERITVAGAAGTADVATARPLLARTAMRGAGSLGGPTALADSGSGVSSISTGASSKRRGALGGADLASGQVRTTATARIACNATDIATLVRPLHATRFARSRLPSGEMRRI